MLSHPLTFVALYAGFATDVPHLKICVVAAASKEVAKRVKVHRTAVALVAIEGAHNCKTRRRKDERRRGRMHERRVERETREEVNLQYKEL